MKISKINLIIASLAGLMLVLIGYLVFIHQKNSSQEINCPDDSGKYQCWRQALNQTLERKGLVASFEVLAKLYDTHPDFVNQCHGFTHELGEKSYRIFSNHKDVEMTSKASYCGYGFYHGFMETLLHSGGGTKEATEFCTYLDKQLSVYGQGTIIQYACYHGIGHGAVDGSDPRAWGDPQKIIEPGLDICRAISDFPKQIHQCGTGVFNALALALNEDLYNLPDLPEPYEICLNQTEEFKVACYEQMNTRVSHLSKGDFKIAAKFVMDIPNRDYAVNAMEQLAPAIIAGKVGQVGTYEKEIKICQSLPEYLKMTCIRGLAGGMLEFGRPDYEYLDAIGFCQSAALHEAEKKSCFNYIISSAKVLYSKDRAQEICSMIDKKYEESCDL